MNATSIIVIAIAVVVVLGMISFVTLARRLRRSRRRCAQRRDPPTRPRRRAGASGRGPGAETRPRPRPRAWSRGPARRSCRSSRRRSPGGAARPEAIGVSRRMFFFRRHHRPMVTAGIGTLSAASFVAFLWPFENRWLRWQGGRGKLDDIKAGIMPAAGSLRAEARTWITVYPADAIPKGEAVSRCTIVAGMRAGVVAFYEKCPHLGCRGPECVSSQWSNARATVRSTIRRGEEGRTRASRHGPLPGHRRRQRRRHRRHRHFVNGPAIGTNTTGQEAEGPHCIGQSEH